MTDTSSLTTLDGLRLSTRSWNPDGEPRAALLVVHGLGEHSGRYSGLAEYFNRLGIAVHAADLRGHGTSEGRRGHLPAYDLLMDDVGRMADWASSGSGDSPLFLYGHSMGGNLVLGFILRNPAVSAGAVVSAPLLRTAGGLPPWKRLAASLLSKIYPAASLSNGIASADLSRDPGVVRAYDEDPLVHDRVTPGFLGLLDAGRRIAGSAATLSVPLLLMHGDADRITSHSASAEFATRAGGLCELILWKGLYHELHNEPERLEVLEKVSSWIERLMQAPQKR